MKEFHGHVVKLIKHREASTIIEDMYALFADASQKAALVEEFYGAEFAVFKKLDRRVTLAQILKDKPEKRKSIMSDLLGVINTVVDKGTIHHTLVHRIIVEFMTEATEDQIQVRITSLNYIRKSFPLFVSRLLRFFILKTDIRLL
jgi:pumilio family protein 6